MFMPMLRVSISMLERCDTWNSHTVWKGNRSGLGLQVQLTLEIKAGTSGGDLTGTILSGLTVDNFNDNMPPATACVSARLDH